MWLVWEKVRDIPQRMDEWIEDLSPVLPEVCGDSKKCEAKVILVRNLLTTIPTLD